MEEIKDIEQDELDVWDDDWLKSYVIELLNGEKTLDEFKDDLISFRNTKYYTGNQDKYKESN